MAHTIQPAPETRAGLAPQASAWLILLIFFGVFCVIVTSTALLGWRYYTTAMIPVDGTLLRSHVNTGVVMLARGQLSPSSLERLPQDRDPCPDSRDICMPISEGASIRTRREAGYGPVASLVLPDTTHIQLWASPTGAEIALDRYQVTQWNRSRQDVVLTQHAGYARYDIAGSQSYTQVDYTIQIDAATSVELVPGSYSIYVPTSDTSTDRLPALTLDGRRLLAEVAVRKGGAIVVRGESRVPIKAGEKIQIAVGGGVSSPLPAEWQLIADGDFQLYTQQNRYGEGSLTWRQYWNENAPGLTTAEKNARFTVVRGCRPEMPDLCGPADQVSIGQLRRDGGQTRPYTIGVEQKLDVDVSEYTSLRLQGWVRVLQQSVPGTGGQGSECPIMIQLVYKPTSPTDQEQARYICVYASDGSTSDLPDLQVIRYRPVPAYRWYHLDIELRDDQLIKQARYIQTIRIEARGHDYLAEVTGFSLIGQQ